MAAQDLLLIFQNSGPIEFNWEDTDFPKPGLSEALRHVHPRMYPTRKPSSTKTHGQVLFKITLARRLMVHFSVPDNAVAERMYEMGMGIHWHALMANNLPPPGLELVPRRDPNDTRWVDLL
jgi:hypothetical protein